MRPPLEVTINGLRGDERDYRIRFANGWFAPQVEAPDWVMDGCSDEVGAFE